MLIAPVKTWAYRIGHECQLEAAWRSDITIHRVALYRCRSSSHTTSFSVVGVRSRGTEVPANGTRAKSRFDCHQSSVKWYQKPSEKLYEKALRPVSGQAGEEESQTVHVDQRFTTRG